jgi:hypothetical protein
MNVLLLVLFFVGIASAVVGMVVISRRKIRQDEAAMAARLNARAERISSYRSVDPRPYSPAPPPRRSSTATSSSLITPVVYDAPVENEQEMSH